MGDKIRVMYSEEEVDKRIRELGEQISKRYEGKTVHMICVLKGGVFFMCELAKRITVPVTMDFMSVSSYGAGTKSSGIVKIVKDLDQSIEGRDVLVVEDIIDSGRTLSHLMKILNERKPSLSPQPLPFPAVLAARPEKSYWNPAQNNSEKIRFPFQNT